MVRRTAGFTLLETLIAAGLLSTILGAAFLMFGTGNRAAVRGMTAIGLMDAANQFEQSLLNDVDQMLVVTGTPALVTDLSGTYLSIYGPDKSKVESVFPSERATPPTTGSWAIYGQEIRYHLVRGAGGTFHPSRNAHVFRDVLVKSWQFDLTRLTSASGQEAPGTAEVSQHPLPPDLLAELGLLPPPPVPQASPSAPSLLQRLESIPTTGSTTGTGGTTGTASSLLIKYQLVDSERRGVLHRSLVFDLSNVRAEKFYGKLFPVPKQLIHLAPRRPIPSSPAEVFDERWEENAEVGH